MKKMIRFVLAIGLALAVAINIIAIIIQAPSSRTAGGHSRSRSIAADWVVDCRAILNPNPRKGLAMSEDNPVGMYEVLDVLEAVLRAADPAKRETLAQTIDAYSDDFPDDFYWAVGARSPVLLFTL